MFGEMAGRRHVERAIIGTQLETLFGTSCPMLEQGQCGGLSPVADPRQGTGTPKVSEPMSEQRSKK